MQNNILEDRVRRYIKIKKFFLLSDALLVTSLNKNTLLNILDKLEDEGLIIKDKDEKSLMNRSYIVLLNRNKKLLKANNIRINIELIKSLNKIMKVLQDLQKQDIYYYELFKLTSFTKGVFANLIKTLVSLKILTQRVELENKENRSFRINRYLLDVLLTFLKQKKYKDLQEILDGKRELQYVEVPDELVSVIGIIIKNEVLTIKELAHLSKLTTRRIKKWLCLMTKLGIVLDFFKENTKEVHYVFSNRRAKTVLKHINNGAYEKDKELKHLWSIKATKS
ncbi:hypothetical protein [Aliarcobacter vitoriensis]|uniref:RNA polymerase III subunit RPC82-related helix-turn-helix domain-containing protein n=1 Tax=Aliarcobacter vitoriensis TaxID=2011099 RepID=A0A366MQR5_9BACT|nr:hypothetical protein [Aliarcobacter vitoriensis]RBQ28387.1 hypothetical protein CRU91_09205 [Aliarcobacter vitoriensis]